MKVSELIDILQDCDEDAEVFVMSQSQWPFEHSLHGVTTRADFTEANEDEEDGDGEAEATHEGPRDRWTASDDQLPSNDVFLVEGAQLRYGSKEAWDAAQRR